MNTITWSRSILNHVVSLVWLGLFGVIVAGCQSATSQSASSAPSAIDSPQEQASVQGRLAAP